MGIEMDKFGRVIKEIRDDGFVQEIQYKNDISNEPKRIETWYPNGQHEIENFYGVHQNQS